MKLHKSCRGAWHAPTRQNGLNQISSLWNGRRHQRFPATRLVFCGILVVLLTVMSVTPAGACGSITHPNLARRAIDALDSQAYAGLKTLLSDHLGQVAYGAVFPDWGMAYANERFWLSQEDKDFYNNISEIAHWPDFEAGMIDYLAPTFKNPSEDDKKAIAFLFGVIAHNEADNPWHFGANSFLSMAMQHDGISHFDAEVEADLFIRDYFEGGWIFGNYCTGWDLPEKAKPAVLGSYTTMGFNNDVISGRLSATVLLDGYNYQGNVCKAESILIRGGQPWEDQNLVSYPEGGLVDMANHIAAAWQQTWDEMNTDLYQIYLPAL